MLEKQKEVGEIINFNNILCYPVYSKYYHFNMKLI